MMNRRQASEQLMNSVNVLILLVIALVYVATGTRIGDDAVAALSGGAVYRGKANGNVALECVVDWNAAGLMDMLDTLKAEDAHITFFVSGRWAKDHAGTLRRMAEEGHEIGTLGYAPTLDGSVGLVARDVRAAAGVIEGITGQELRYYYPGMRARQTSVRAAESLGLTAVAASVDLLSARYEAAEIAARASKQAFDGSILTIRPTAAGAEALTGVLRSIRESGYAPSTVGEVLEEKE